MGLVTEEDHSGIPKEVRLEGSAGATLPWEGPRVFLMCSKNSLDLLRKSNRGRAETSRLAVTVLPIPLARRAAATRMPICSLTGRPTQSLYRGQGPTLL